MTRGENLFLSLLFGIGSFFMGVFVLFVIFALMVDGVPDPSLIVLPIAIGAAAGVLHWKNAQAIDAWLGRTHSTD